MSSNDTMTFEQQVVELTNLERAKQGLQPLKANAELNYTADKYAEDMSERGVLSHTGADGSRPWDRAKEVGYEAQAMGENIAVGQKTPEEVVKAWMNSPGHRANILRTQYTEIGTGFNDNYWVQNFGSGDRNPISKIPGAESNSDIASNSDSTSEPISTPKTPEPNIDQGASPKSNETTPKPSISSNSFEPTAYEQYMLELINRARANPQAEEERQGTSLTQGLGPERISYEEKQPLAWNEKLSKAAQDHNQWQDQTGTFSHYGDGGWPWERAYKAGYDMTAPQSSEANENLSMGASSKLKSATQYVEERHNSLYKSSGHRANFFNPNWKEAGIDFLGKVGADGENLSKATVVQFFGNPASGKTFLTGVAYNDLVKDDDFYTPGEGLGGIKVEAIRQSDNQTFTTETFESGGYQIALEPGEYKVSFSEGNLEQPLTETIKIDSKNLKLDLVNDQLVAGIFSSNPDLDPSPLASNPTTQGGDNNDPLTGGTRNDTKQDYQWRFKDGMGKDKLKCHPEGETVIAGWGEKMDMMKDLQTGKHQRTPFDSNFKEAFQIGRHTPIEGMNDNTLIPQPKDTTPSLSMMS
ncbi:MAG: CAP domain-containing protein [Scytonema sp. PMC 1069.18]|nr:CAP domain-containing protein [Scytonema sp. PMC 1069.18]MEC4880756.1 CAP domain-containing protein [Scytonema sp. PMC 1070.18]